MIPDFWLQTMVNVWCCCITAFITGGDSVLKVCDDHMHYGVRYRTE